MVVPGFRLFGRASATKRGLYGTIARMQVTFPPCSQSALGGVTAATKIRVALVPGSGTLQLLSLMIGYTDTGNCYVQLHDALPDDVATATMVWPFGLLLDASTSLIQLVSWGLDAPLFKTAVTLATSSTAATYTSSAKVFVAKGSWL